MRDERTDKRLNDDGIVYDENQKEVSPLDDDYEYYKSEQEAMTNPLSDDYIRRDY